jgi:perosamine synthetase
MPISRGSIKHSLYEDLTNLIKVYLSRGLTGRASDETRQRLKDELRNRFSVEHVELFPYARTAFYSALVSLNLPKGSKVLMTPITIGPMLEIVINLGYEPIFVDIELETFGPDLDDLKFKLQEGPSCFLLTYLFGYVPDVGKIAEMCKLANCTLLEDISHNIGGQYEGKPLGTFGAVGIYSASLLKYVDGYNGAFALISSAELDEKLTAQAASLSEPNPKRIRDSVRRTIIWNLALSRYFFSLITYPMLWVLKLVSPASFEKLLGPSIKLAMHKTLPGYWFEDIAEIQCQTILTHLHGLDGLLASRRAMATRAATAVSGSAISTRECNRPDKQDAKRSNTFWQYVVEVPSVVKAREELFRHGVETGTTNLLDIAKSLDKNLKNAEALKEKHIFIPLHSYITAKGYKSIVSHIAKD